MKQFNKEYLSTVEINEVNGGNNCLCFKQYDCKGSYDTYADGGWAQDKSPGACNSTCYSHGHASYSWIGKCFNFN